MGIRDLVFEAACRALEVMDPDPADPARRCYGMFQLSYEVLRAFDRVPGSFREHLPDVRVHRVEVGPEVGLVTCFATCPRFSARESWEAPPLYEFQFTLHADGRVTSTVVQR